MAILIFIVFLLVLFFAFIILVLIIPTIILYFTNRKLESIKEKKIQLKNNINPRVNKYQNNIQRGIDNIYSPDYYNHNYGLPVNRKHDEVI